MRTRTGSLLVVVATVAVVLGGCSSDDDTDDGHQGHDAGEHIDPVADDPAIAATAVASTLLSWNPAEQSSPMDVPVSVIDDSMTGELAEQARDPSGDDSAYLTPQQWDDWADAKATVKAFVTDTEVTADDDTAAEVTTTVRQDLSYPDGARSTLSTTDYQITLDAVDGRWKANTIKEN